MKSTKYFLVATMAVGALIAAGSSLHAQNETNTPPVAGHHGAGKKGFQDMVKALDLTPDQQPKVEAIMKDSMAKHKALREDASLSSQDRRTKMQAIRADTMAKMKAILTPEQFAKFEKMGPGMHGNRSPGGTPESGGADGLPPAN